MATDSSILVWNIPDKNGQRTLAGCKTWGLKESDTTEHECARVCAHAHIHTHTHTHVFMWGIPDHNVGEDG